MDYTINQLRVFVTVVELKSITKAAEALHLTQPAVSIQLKNFQNQFDIALTEVVGRQLYVTDFGMEIAEAAGNILVELEKIAHRTSAFKGLLTGRLRISVVSTGKYVMPYFMSAFIRQNPEVDLVMDVTNKSEVIRSLEKNEVDFSLVSILPENLALEHLDLLENKLVLVTNAANGNFTGGDLNATFKEHPLIYREPGSGTRQTMEKFFTTHKIVPGKKIELTSNEAVKQAVLAGLGYSIMPVLGSEQEIRDGRMKVIPVRGLPIKTMWQLIWLKGKKHSPEAEAYLRHLQEHRGEIIRQHFENV